eukprot:g51149.t1
MTFQSVYRLSAHLPPMFRHDISAKTAEKKHSYQLGGHWALDCTIVFHWAVHLNSMAEVASPLDLHRLSQDLHAALVGNDPQTLLQYVATYPKLHLDLSYSPQIGLRLHAKGALLVSPSLKNNNNLHSLSLDDNNLGPEGARAIVSALRASRSLSTLSLKKNALGPEGIREIAVALEQGKSRLTELDLTGNNMGPEGSKHLAAVLKNNMTLLSLAIGDNEIGEEGALAFAGMLEANSTLQTLWVTEKDAIPVQTWRSRKQKYLDLSGCNIGVVGAVLLASVLKDNAHLRGLSLRGNAITAAGCRSICQLIRANQGLHSLTLAKNNIGDEGVQHVADVLQNNSSIEHLDLCANEIGPAGLAHLARVMEKNRGLDTLVLAQNPLGPEQGAAAVAAICEAGKALALLGLKSTKLGAAGTQVIVSKLMTNTTLTELSLMDNNIGDEGAKHVAEMLRQNKGLTSLSLKANDIGPEGTKAIASSMSLNNTLNTLILADNAIGVQGAEAVAGMLRPNQARGGLQFLSLKGVGLGPKGAKMIAAALEGDTGLTSLGLADNAIGEEGCAALVSMLRKNESLRSLDLRDNKLLSFSFGQLFLPPTIFPTRIEQVKLSFQGNQLKNPPQSEVDTPALARAYLDKLNREGGERLSPVRVMVVGHGGVGKTTLCDRVFLDRRQLPSLPAWTRQDVHNWAELVGLVKATRDWLERQDSVEWLSMPEDKLTEWLAQRGSKLSKEHTQQLVTNLAQLQVAATEAEHNDQGLYVSTAGVRVGDTVTLSASVDETKSVFESDKLVDVQFLDFAGQTEYYMAHQAFLGSPLAVYVAVSNLCHHKSQRAFNVRHDPLHVASLLSPDSPLARQSSGGWESDREPGSPKTPRAFLSRPSSPLSKKRMSSSEVSSGYSTLPKPSTHHTRSHSLSRSLSVISRSLPQPPRLTRKRASISGSQPPSPSPTSTSASTVTSATSTSASTVTSATSTSASTVTSSAGPPALTGRASANSSSSSSSSPSPHNSSSSLSSSPSPHNSSSSSSSSPSPRKLTPPRAHTLHENSRSSPPRDLTSRSESAPLAALREKDPHASPQHANNNNPPFPTSTSTSDSSSTSSSSSSSSSSPTSDLSRASFPSPVSARRSLSVNATGNMQHSNSVTLPGIMERSNSVTSPGTTKAALNPEMQTQLLYWMRLLGLVAGADAPLQLTAALSFADMMEPDEAAERRLALEAKLQALFPAWFNTKSSGGKSSSSLSRVHLVQPFPRSEALRTRVAAAALHVSKGAFLPSSYAAAREACHDRSTQLLAGSWLRKRRVPIIDLTEAQQLFEKHIRSKLRQSKVKPKPEFQDVMVLDALRFLHSTADIFLVSDKFRTGNPSRRDFDNITHDEHAFVVLSPLLNISQLVTCFIADPGHDTRVRNCGEKGVFAWKDILQFPGFFERGRPLQEQEVQRVMKVLTSLFLCFESVREGEKVYVFPSSLPAAADMGASFRRDTDRMEPFLSASTCSPEALLSLCTVSTRFAVVLTGKRSSIQAGQAFFPSTFFTLLQVRLERHPVLKTASSIFRYSDLVIYYLEPPFASVGDSCTVRLSLKQDRQFRWLDLLFDVTTQSNTLLTPQHKDLREFCLSCVRAVSSELLACVAPFAAAVRMQGACPRCLYLAQCADHNLALSVLHLREGKADGADGQNTQRAKAAANHAGFQRCMFCNAPMSALHLAEAALDELREMERAPERTSGEGKNVEKNVDMEQDQEQELLEDLETYRKQQPGDSFQTSKMSFYDLFADSEMKQPLWSLEEERKEMLGEGNFGRVLKGYWRKVPVAVKMLRSDRVSSVATEEFLEEAELNGQLSFGDRVVTCFGVDMSRKRPCIVLEYMVGNSLPKRLKAQPPVNTLLRLRMLCDAASGLLHLHNQGFIHRDVRADNFLVDGLDHCYISDFGLTRRLETPEETQVLATGYGGFPWAWSAPEVFRTRRCSRATDVWMFGMLLWELWSEQELQLTTYVRNKLNETEESGAAGASGAEGPVLPGSSAYKGYGSRHYSEVEEYNEYSKLASEYSDYTYADQRPTERTRT